MNIFYSFQFVTFLILRKCDIQKGNFVPIVRYLIASIVVYKRMIKSRALCHKYEIIY